MPAIDISKTDGIVTPIYDKRGACNIYFENKSPSSADRAAHNKGVGQMKGKKYINNSYENDLFFGAKLMTGLRAAKKNAKEQWDEGLLFDGKPFCSDPEDKEHYRSDWKEILVKFRPDLVSELGAKLMDTSGSDESDKDDKENDLSSLGLGQLEDNAPLPEETTLNAT